MSWWSRFLKKKDLDYVGKIKEIKKIIGFDRGSMYLIVFGDKVPKEEIKTISRNFSELGVIHMCARKKQAKDLSFSLIDNVDWSEVRKLLKKEATDEA